MLQYPYRHSVDIGTPMRSRTPILPTCCIACPCEVLTLKTTEFIRANALSIHNILCWGRYCRRQYSQQCGHSLYALCYAGAESKSKRIGFCVASDSILWSAATNVCDSDLTPSVASLYTFFNTWFSKFRPKIIPYEELYKAYRSKFLLNNTLIINEIYLTITLLN